MASAAELATAYRARLRTLAVALQARIRTVYGRTVGEERQLPLGAIRIHDAGRAELSEAIIRAALGAIDAIPPIVVLRDGSRYELLDGRHRLEAARRAGRTGIPAVVAATGDIDAAFAAYLAAAVPVIAGAQASGTQATLAYLSLLLPDAELDVPRGILGTTREGLPLADGMGAFPAMVKAAIADGKTFGAALLFGRFLALRFADAETTGAVDRAELLLAGDVDAVRGWEGVLSGDSCPACRQRNPGFHPMHEPMYRHGGCDCTKRIVTAEA